jgi:hypothetical protein
LTTERRPKSSTLFQEPLDSAAAVLGHAGEDVAIHADRASR